jgi:hypothetical protein
MVNFSRHTTGSHDQNAMNRDSGEECEIFIRSEPNAWTLTVVYHINYDKWLYI